MDAKERDRRGERNVAAILGVVIAVAAGIFCLWLFIAGNREPVVAVEDGAVRIDAMYGLTLPLDEVEGVSMWDKTPRQIAPDGVRTNGYGLGDTLRGHFHSEALGDYLLFADAGASPTICIERTGGQEDIYLNYRDGEQTESVYALLAETMDELVRSTPEELQQGLLAVRTVGVGSVGCEYVLLAGEVTDPALLLQTAKGLGELSLPVPKEDTTGTRVLFDFDLPPESMRLVCFGQGQESAGEVPLDGVEFTAPGEAGDYIYAAYLFWSNGTAETAVFRAKVFLL